MTHTRIVVHVAAAAALLICLAPLAAAQTWESAGTLPTGGAPRVYAAGVNAEGVIYAIGGTPWRNGADSDGSVHQLVDGTWSEVAALGGAGPVIGGAAGVDNLGRIVIFGGYVDGDGGPGPEAVYEPVDGPADGLAARDVPETAVGYFAWARDGAGYLYGFGGGLGAGAPNSGYCDRYDGVTDSWTVLAPMPTPAADACAACDGAGHILVCGGIDASGTNRLANVAQYDISSDTWSDAAIDDLPLALSGARAVLGADERVYVIGGETGLLGAGTTSAAVFRLEPDGSWSTAAPLATPRKWFACVLGDDDYIYAIGGDNDAGGTDTAEKLFTPRCPTIISQPAAQVAWRDTVAAFAVDVEGAAPLTYEWRKDGVALSDGLTASGSEITGAATSELVIRKPRGTDAGVYDVVVSNACGAATSGAAELTLRAPPLLPKRWTVTNIHPTWADGASYARGVGSGRIVGEAVTATPLPDGRVLDLAHPVAWDATNLVGSDQTPPGSVGGGILGVSGDYLVGWFWHTYSCYSGGQWWTCGWMSAGYWAGDPLVFDEVHASGAEYDSVSATNGSQMVGTVTYEYTEGQYTSYAYLWTPPSGAISLHPASGASNSGAAAIDGARQYGWFHTPYPGPVTHAAMWAGSAASVVDLHPAGYTRSWVSGAGDGQAVGSADSGSALHAGLWTGSAATFIDLNPRGVATSSANAAAGGLQVGMIAGRAALWAGTPQSVLDLGSFAPPEIAGSVAESLEVTADGAITVVGYGYNSLSGRYEALLWRASSTPIAEPKQAGAVWHGLTVRDSCDAAPEQCVSPVGRTSPR